MKKVKKDIEILDIFGKKLSLEKLFFNSYDIHFIKDDNISEKSDLLFLDPDSVLDLTFL